MPSCAVTTTLMVLAPTVKLSAPDADPLATVVPLTVIEAKALLAKGVKVKLLILLPTDAL